MYLGDNEKHKHARSRIPALELMRRSFKNKANFPKRLSLSEAWNQNFELLANIKVKLPEWVLTILTSKRMDKKLLYQAKPKILRFCKFQDPIQSSNHQLSDLRDKTNKKAQVRGNMRSVRHSWETRYTQLAGQATNQR